MVNCRENENVLPLRRYPFSQSTGPTEAEGESRLDGVHGLDLQLNKEVNFPLLQCPWWNICPVQGQRPPENLKMRQNSQSMMQLSPTWGSKINKFIYISAAASSKDIFPSAADYNTSRQQRKRKKKAKRNKKNMFFSPVEREMLTPGLSMKPATWGRGVLEHISHSDHRLPLEN